MLQQVRLLVQRQEGGAADVPALEVLHARLRALHRVHHYVVQGAAASRYGYVVFCVYSSKVSLLFNIFY